MGEAGDGFCGGFRGWDIGSTKNGTIEAQGCWIVYGQGVEPEIFVAYGKGQRGMHGRDDAHRELSALDFLKHTGDGRRLAAEDNLAGGIDDED